MQTPKGRKEMSENNRVMGMGGNAKMVKGKTNRACWWLHLAVMGREEVVGVQGDCQTWPERSGRIWCCSRNREQGQRTRDWKGGKRKGRHEASFEQVKIELPLKHC